MRRPCRLRNFERAPVPTHAAFGITAAQWLVSVRLQLLVPHKGQLDRPIVGQIRERAISILVTRLGEFEVAGFRKIPLAVPKPRSLAGSLLLPNWNFHPKSKSSFSRGASAGSAAAEVLLPDMSDATRAQAERLTSDAAEAASPERSTLRREMRGMGSFL